jgi:predicted PurR-regulated permease PerM
LHSGIDQDGLKMGDSNTRGSLLDQAVTIRQDPPETAIMRQLVRRLTIILVLLGLAFCYFASSVCIAVILAAFLSILVDPFVRALEKIWIPRFFGAGLIVLAGVAVIGLLVYVSYGKLTDFSDKFPQYVSRVGEAISPISSKIQRVQDSAGALAHESTPKRVPEVRIRESASWAGYLVRGVGSVWGAVIIAAVVPFLVYFMLLTRDGLCLRLKTMLGKRFDLDPFLERLNAMVRGYVAGNLVIGALLSAVSIVVFWRVGLEQAVILGLISGTVNLIPFLGMLIALIVPLVAGVFQFHSPAPFIIIGGTVVALHFIAANLLIPRFIGSRLDIGPVAATIGLLFWGWLWGIPGILLAVPLTAFLKLLADTDPSMAPLSNFLARDPRRISIRKLGRDVTAPSPSADAP